MKLGIIAIKIFVLTYAGDKVGGVEFVTSVAGAGIGGSTVIAHLSAGVVSKTLVDL